MKKMLAALLMFSMMFVLAACGSDSESSGEGNKGYVGISMPTKSSERWVLDGENMVKEFKEMGYKTDLQYGEDVVEDQIAQIENMITKGVDVLVVAPIDGESLTEVLQKAADQDIKVISYDRLIK